MTETTEAQPMDAKEVVVATLWTPKMIVLAGTWHWVRSTEPPVGITKLLVVTAEVAAGPTAT